MEDNHVDPLDAFMAALDVPPEVLAAQVPAQVATMEDVEVALNSSSPPPSGNGADDETFLRALEQGISNPSTTTSSDNPALVPSTSTPAADNDSDDGGGGNDDGDNGEQHIMKSVLDIVKDKAKKKEIRKVDHSTIDYPAFRKDFYVPSPHVANMSEDTVRRNLAEFDIKVRGHNPPRMISAWEECGLSGAFLTTLQANNWPTPFVIQRQAVPCIMSGRDVVGIAQTGSGKTLAYLVPMIRHVLDQPPPRAGDGCIGLVIAPTRELAIQVNDEVLKFQKTLGVTSACLYGGTNVGDQTAAVRRGVHIVVGTPGRLIDVLAARGGKTFPLKRVTFVVLDEADRLFDMGFEPQVERILENVRPDRQMVMFSATFPAHVERLARSTLTGAPLHIVCGGSGGPGTAAAHIDQTVEYRNSEDEKYARLLQLLGEWYAKGCCILVFCDSQVHVDELYAKLERNGYQCLSLHAGKDQVDRDFTIKDFKSKTRTVMIATGVAGRGLDVVGLDLVINYNTPNHFEEYIHRVGRTGRAGRKGTAITFCSDEDAKYAGDLVSALKSVEQPIPEFLIKMARDFKVKVNAGTEHKRKSGYNTKGFSFDPSEDVSDYSAQVKRAKTEQIKVLTASDPDAPSLVNGEGEDVAHTAKDLFQAHPVKEAKDAALAPVTGIITPFAPASSSSSGTSTTATTQGNVNKFQIVAKGTAPMPNQGLPVMSVANLTDAEKRLIEAQRKKAVEAGKAPMEMAPVIMTALDGKSKSAAAAAQSGVACEVLEINDLPVKVRQMISSKKSMSHIEQEFKVSLTLLGNYIAPGRVTNLGEKKLQLKVESPDPMSVRGAMMELNRTIHAATANLTVDQAVEHVGGMSAGGKYRRQRPQQQRAMKKQRGKETKAEESVTTQHEELDEVNATSRKRNRASKAVAVEDVDEEEEQLAQLLFGDSAQPATNLFQLDTVGDNDVTKPSSSSAAAAWVDPDDEKVLVDIAGTKSRLRKLRRNKAETVVSGTEYASRLRKTHGELMHSSQPDWTLPDRKLTSSHQHNNNNDEMSADDDDDMDNIFASSKPLIMDNHDDPVQTTSTSTIVRIKRLSNANTQSPSDSVITAIDFHPTAPIMLSSGLDKQLHLFRVDGEDNPKIFTTRFEDLPIRKAKFAGTEHILTSGRRPWYYVVDVESGAANRVGGIFGRTSDKSFEHFTTSPNGRVAAFCCMKGIISLVSMHTCREINHVCVEQGARFVEFAGEESDHRLLVSGKTGMLYEWDLRHTGRGPLRQFKDVGNLGTSALATTAGALQSGGRFAIGSTSGVVNVYHGFGGGESKNTPEKEIKNLTTAIDSLAFDRTGTFLALASRIKKDQLKLFHVPSQRVVANWPTQRTPLGYVQCVTFSPDGHMLAVGNDKGKVLLYGIK